MFKHRRLIIFLAVFGAVIISAAGYLRQKYVIPIIMYHSVNPAHNPAIERLIVSPRTFERQMRFLKRNKYNVIPLETIADLINNKKKIPPRTIAITFDDGYKDNYTYGYPILKKYNLPAAVFIITGEVGRQDRLSWEDIKEMQGSGLIAFGSHTLGPQPLINIKSQQEIKRQVFESKKIMEDKLSRQVNMFSYPEGRFNDDIISMVKDAGYKLAAATSPGKKFKNNGVFILKRIRISENAANMFIFAVETSGYYTFMKEYKR